MSQPIHIVEPTLRDHAGHCHSFIASICRADPDRPFHVWAGHDAGPLLADLNQVTVHRHFHRRIRKLQSPLLYRRLLRRPGRILVPTAGSADLVSLGPLPWRPIPPGKIFLYFHWIRPTASKRERYARIARRQPGIEVLGQTPVVADFLKDAGFSRARVVPYPATFSVPPAEQEQGFRHVLYAGAARRDKGFDKAVDLIELMADRNRGIATLVQTCGDYYGKVDPDTREDLARLERIGYEGLTVEPRALDTPDFLRMFRGAICIQPYDRADFADRFSNVTVDAFRCGAPVVATGQTWLGRQVERFDAGAAVDDISAQSLLAAVERILDDYARYSANARIAGGTLAEEHRPTNFLNAIVSD